MDDKKNIVIKVKCSTSNKNKPSTPTATVINQWNIKRIAALLGGLVFFILVLTYLFWPKSENETVPSGAVLSAKEIVSRVNNELSDRNSNQYFVTLFIGIIDIRSGIMDYCNAAHNYPYLLHPDGAIYTISQSHGLPLGIYKGKTYKNNVIELQSGDLIILYTDGVINSRDDKKLHYGTERLEKNIQNLMNLTAEEATLSLLKSILLHEGEEKQADDITLMLFKFNGKRENQT